MTEVTGVTMTGGRGVSMTEVRGVTMTGVRNEIGTEAANMMKDDSRPTPEGKTGKFAVLVGDAWQGKGIGSNLLEKNVSRLQNSRIMKRFTASF